jgi:hypothetical protein
MPRAVLAKIDIYHLQQQKDISQHLLAYRRDNTNYCSVLFSTWLLKPFHGFSNLLIEATDHAFLTSLSLPLIRY